MMGRKEPWDILEKPPLRLDFFGNPDDFPEETGAFPAKSCPLSGDTEVLAGESTAEEINTAGGWS